MMLTTSTPEVFPPQLYRDVGSGSGDPTNPSPTRIVTIGNLPDEVLLDIFDLYRQSFGDQPSFEKAWNNKNGWFKLAHVCHNWRSVVLGSPSRLQLRLYFSHNTPTRAVALERLSQLPIIVDYNIAVWKASTMTRFQSALRYPNRVCRIAITRRQENFDEISEALDSPFPALESLEVHNVRYGEPISFPASLTNSAQSLRHLQLVGARLTSLIPLLSVTRALVDLTLSIDTVFCSTAGASLLTHLQHMSLLRNLQVTTQLHFAYEGMENPSTTVLLPELTSFRVFGGRTQIEWFTAGLVTPSLRELRIYAIDLVFDVSPTCQIASYLCKFIRVAEVVFLAARLTMSLMSPKISLFAYPHSIDDPPSKIVSTNMRTAIHLGSVLTATLASLEDIFLSDFDNTPFYYPSLFGNCIPWRKFFEEFRNVKVLRLHHGLETEVMDILRQPNVNPPPPQEGVDQDATAPSGTPINSNKSQFTLDIFPSLEEVVVYTRTPDAFVGETERASVLESFGPFGTARHQMGRPVKVFWSTDGEFPRYCIP